MVLPLASDVSGASAMLRTEFNHWLQFVNKKFMSARAEAEQLGAEPRLSRVESLCVVTCFSVNVLHLY